MTTVEVFADVGCPFTHVGLKRIVHELAEIDRPAATSPSPGTRRTRSPISTPARVSIRVRAWPLEWVNRAPMEFAAVERSARALTAQLGVDDFSGLRGDRWPTTTVPAHELAARASRVDPARGLAVSLALRAALFEQGRDIADRAVLADLASEHDLPGPDPADRAAVAEDFAEGRRRGVRGSPHFWIGADDYFCPSLDIDRDADGGLTTRFDPAGLAEFLARLRR